MHGISHQWEDEWSDVELSLEQPIFEELGQIQGHEFFSTEIENRDHSHDLFSIQIPDPFSAPTVHATRPASPIAPNPQNKETKCPCCKATIDITKTDLHAHVSKCFVDNKQAFLQKNNAQCASSTHDTINSIRNNAACLDLSQRIALLESLDRLVHSAEEGRGRRHTPREEFAAISLLYSSEKKMHKDVDSAMDREVRTPTCSQHATPPLNPKVTFNQSRKRSCQALQFSPGNSPKIRRFYL